MQIGDGTIWMEGFGGPAALADNRPMPQQRPRLTESGVQPLQDPRDPAARRHPPPARYAAVETGGVAEMPVIPQGPHCAVGAHDPADGAAGAHALAVGASG
jgi:hypothetical protein